MIIKNLNEINLSDFQSLIENGVAESKTIEYKLDLTLENDSDKKEFLYDVSSFANASGGDLIFGISEDRASGLPSKLEGIKIDNADELKRRLESLIRDGVAPRIAGVQIEAYPIDGLQHILIIRIPKSWNSPHQVIFKNADKFYTRASNSKYKLDVSQLRDAFLASDTIADRVRKFREDRISKIISNEMPGKLHSTAKIAMHLIPLTSFEPGKSYDLSNNSLHESQFAALGGAGWDLSYNLDGLLSFGASTQGIHHGYLQLFRNGIIETVNSSILLPYDGGLYVSSTRYIDFEFRIIEALNAYRILIKILKIDLPIYVYISLIGVKNYSLQSSRINTRYWQGPVIDRDMVILPELVLEDLDKQQSDQFLKPAFDMIWNACGHQKSLNYDSAGNWIGAK